MTDGTIRLQKYLAERGIASRRAAADIIRTGRVAVNAERVTEAGFRIDPAQDVITIDGASLPAAREPFRTILMYKPRGYICSRSGEQGKTVFELLKGVEERLVPVGRLDKDSEGLLLLSNDGELVNRLTHPSYGHTKTYYVTVSGDTGKEAIQRLGQPFTMDGYRTQPAAVRIFRASIPAPQAPDRGHRVILEIVLAEGRNRQIREMCRQTKLRIHRLVRVAIGTLRIAGLKPGQWRELSDQEAERL